MITYSVPITREFDINVVLSKWDKHEFEVLPLVSDEEENWESWLVYRKGYSTTPFVLVSDYESELLTLYMEELASYKDYEFFPFFCKELANYFEIDLEGFESEDFVLDEFWIQDRIGEEIAYLKVLLSAGYRYYFSFGTDEDLYVDAKVLEKFAVSVHSSTPRIYGYIQYALKNSLLPSDINDSEDLPDIELDVPQHMPIGKVKSWQLDGSETWETYAIEDVNMLLDIEQRVLLAGNHIVAPVVLNDIGTIYQEGIGVQKNASKAAFWFDQAILAGDKVYAPSNLGDVYRKGGPSLAKSLPKAYEAYLRGIDPYAHYRVGQAWEEGWHGTIDYVEAYKWFTYAAAEGHHLALKRLKSKKGLDN